MHVRQKCNPGTNADRCDRCERGGRDCVRVLKGACHALTCPIISSPRLVPRAAKHSSAGVGPSLSPFIFESLATHSPRNYISANEEIEASRLAFAWGERLVKATADYDDAFHCVKFTKGHFDTALELLVKERVKELRRRPESEGTDKERPIVIDDDRDDDNDMVQEVSRTEGAIGEDNNDVFHMEDDDDDELENYL
jgi:hypothetical protein